MMEKKEQEVIRKLKKANKKKEKSNYVWVLEITLIALVISFVFSLGSETILPNVNMLFSMLLVIIFIMIGILFDMIGVSVTAANERPFHSMSAQKVKGSKVAIKLIHNANKVSSFCNDVIGDICGIISGSAGVIVASNIVETLHTDPLFTSLVITAIIAALTIGGKALGKSFAINKSNIIVYEFSKIISYIYKPKK